MGATVNACRRAPVSVKKVSKVSSLVHENAKFAVMSKKHNAPNNSKNPPLRPRAIKPAVYPFAGIVGQSEMKLALLLNVIDPSIGGVLIMGHRGTGKSTAVRALADLLPQITCARDCFYGCDPFDEENMCDACFA